MKVKELLQQLDEHMEDEVYFSHKMHGTIMPEEIRIQVKKVEHTQDGIILS